MSLELRKVKIHDDMSEETTCFSAEMWEGGVKIGYVKNDGRGGCDHITPTKGNQKLADSYMESYDNGKYYNPVSDLLADWDVVTRNQTKKLVFKDTKGGYYSIGFGKNSIASMKKNPKGLEAIMNVKKREEKLGSRLLNRNV